MYDTILLQATNQKRDGNFSGLMRPRNCSSLYMHAFYFNVSFLIPHTTYRVGTALVTVMTWKKRCSRELSVLGEGWEGGRRFDLDNAKHADSSTPAIN